MQVVINCKNARFQAKWWTHNHWHGRVETYPLHYQVNAP